LTLSSTTCTDRSRRVLWS